MTYTPTVWECGDVITAEKLNKLEQAVAQGGSSAPLIVTMSDRDATIEECPSGGFAADFSHSWQEMYDAAMADKQVWINMAKSSDDPESSDDIILHAVGAFMKDSTTQRCYIQVGTQHRFTFNSPDSKVSLQCNAE